MKLKLSLIPILVVLAMVYTSCQSDHELEQFQSMKSSNPNRISLNDALSTADATMSLISGNTRSQRKIVKDVSCLIRPTTRGVNQIDTALYLVNYENGGFALLGADKRLCDLYAISDEGSLSWNDTIQNRVLAEYFRNVQASIQAVEDDWDGAPVISTTTNIDGYQYVNDQLIKKMSKPKLAWTASRWGQDYPLNKYCTVDMWSFNPKYYRIGCMPLATAMIMSFYGQPTKVSGERYVNVTIDWYKVRNQIDEENIEKFFDILCDANNLNPSRSETETTVPRAQMKESVVRTFTNYGYTVSDIIYSFDTAKIKDWLGYDVRTPNEKFDTSWTPKFGHPVFVASDVKKETSYGTSVYGHGWVIDGYITRVTNVNGTLKDCDFFHCVWGWDGECNGYYNWSLNKQFSGNIDFASDIDFEYDSLPYVVNSNFTIFNITR